MPINPNIALGIQPIQQPNVLGQYAQVMGIKAAQQEMEGNESTRNYFSRPVSERGDPSQLLGTKQGQAAYKALNEGQVKQLEAEQKRINLIGAGAGAVLENPTMETFTSVVSNLVDRGIYTPQQRDQAFAAIGNDPSKIKAFVTPIFNQAISAEKRLSDITSRRNQDVASGASYQQAALAREKFEFEKANPGFTLQTLDNGNIAAVNKRTNAVTILQTPSAAPTNDTSATPPVNAFATTSAAPPSAASLNALINPPVVNQPGAPTITNAAALAPTPLRAAPRPGYQYNAQGQQVPISDPTKVVNTVTDKFGNVSMLNAAGDVIRKVEGMGKPSAGVERQQEKEVVSKEGKESVNRVLGNLYSEYTNLVKTGGITDTRQSVEENISARTGASAVGQLTGSFTGSEAQSFRDSIEQTRPLLLTAIMKATGLSATQLNSNVELQTYLKTATDPKVSIQSNVKALNNISSMFGLGEKFEVPEIPKATSSPKAAKPANAVPPGLPPDIAALWPYISLEDRKLWQK
jgi:hypothetical protein